MLGGVDEAQVWCRPPDQLCSLQCCLERLSGWIGLPAQTRPGHGQVKGQRGKRLYQTRETGEHRAVSVLPSPVFILAQAGLPQLDVPGTPGLSLLDQDSQGLPV